MVRELTKTETDALIARHSGAMAAFSLDEDTPEALAQMLVGYDHTAMTTTQAKPSCRIDL